MQHDDRPADAQDDLPTQTSASPTPNDPSPTTLQDLEDRAQNSNERLKKFTDSLLQEATEVLAKLPDLCLYCAGSYARKEASPYSDLDLFFLHTGASVEAPVSNLEKTLLDAAIIATMRAQDFPDPSGEGRYLEIHHLKDLLAALGSPSDDYHNYFTARILLLLESKPVHNTEVYWSSVNSVIESYYRDYHDHANTFLPVFLINDVIRYWKTVCLNYEHRRNRPAEDLQRRNENHLKNLKLKFSRVFTCFSFIISLSFAKAPINPAAVAEVVSLTPRERLERTVKLANHDHDALNSILELYRWFLNVTERPKKEQLVWIGDRRNRDAAFDKGRKFGDELFRMLREVSNEDMLRYIVM